RKRGHGSRPAGEVGPRVGASATSSWALFVVLFFRGLADARGPFDTRLERGPPGPCDLGYKGGYAGAPHEHLPQYDREERGESSPPALSFGQRLRRLLRHRRHWLDGLHHRADPP